MAKQIAQYGEPILFRLNNEMNSDWTCWSAVNAMLDPEIFTETWIRMHDIFEEEGANANCIWESSGGYVRPAGKLERGAYLYAWAGVRGYDWCDLLQFRR